MHTYMLHANTHTYNLVGLPVHMLTHNLLIVSGSSQRVLCRRFPDLLNELTSNRSEKKRNLDADESFKCNKH